MYGEDNTSYIDHPNIYNALWRARLNITDQWLYTNWP